MATKENQNSLSERLLQGDESATTTATKDKAQNKSHAVVTISSGVSSGVSSSGASSGETKISAKNISTATHANAEEQTYFHAPADQQQDIKTPCIGGFHVLLVCIAILPVLCLLCVAAVGYYLKKDISILGLSAVCCNFIPLVATSTVTQTFFGIGIKPETPGAQKNNTTRWEKIQWIHLTLMTCVGMGYAVVLLWPIGWWTYGLISAGILFFLFVFINFVYWTAPALKKAIDLNLNTQARLQHFQKKLLIRFFGSILFQIFVLTLFIYPALGLDDGALPGKFAGSNSTIDMYANGAPMFIQFALPSWWYGFFLSFCFGLGPLLLTLVEGSGTFEAAKSTGKFGNKIATVLILWYLIIFFGAIQLPNCIVQHTFKLTHVSVLDGLHTGWNSIYTLFFVSLSVAQVLCGSLSLHMLSDIAKMTEALKGSNKWHFFISHMQSNGGDQCSTLCAQLKQRGWSVWYDNEMSEFDEDTPGSIDAEGMKEGARDSAVFILFMTKGIFTRPFVRLEVKEAVKSGKPIMLLHEIDDRHGKFDFDTTTNVPKEFQPIAANLLRDNESIGWERRGFKQEAVIDQIKQKFYQALGVSQVHSALLEQLGETNDPEKIRGAFNNADTDLNGSLDEDGLSTLVKSLGITLTPVQIHAIFNTIDKKKTRKERKKKSGGITLKEFEDWYNGYTK